MNFHEISRFQHGNSQSEFTSRREDLARTKSSGDGISTKYFRVLTEAISEYIQRRRIRPVVRAALAESIAESYKLGEMLAI